LGKARVMSYEDLQVARAKRAEKEADKAGKKKQGRKRRSRMQETCRQGTAEGAVQAGRQESTGILLQVAETRREDSSVLAPYPSRAPVARMW
jgi:hypothetical protein